MVSEYERISGKEPDQTVRIATVMEEAPPHLPAHLRLRSEEIGTDYKKVILAFKGYVRLKKTWDSGGPVDMDIGAVNKGEGQPKGTGKSKGKGNSDKAQDSQKAKAKTKEKAKEPKHNEHWNKSDRNETWMDNLPKVVITAFVQ